MTEHGYSELDKFFAVSLDLLCITDLQGHFIKLNQQWNTTLGYELEELVQGSFIGLIHPDDLEGTYRVMGTLGSGGTVTNFVNRYRCKDGSYKHLEWQAKREDELVYAVARDITERIKEREALERMVEISEEFMQSYGDYLDYHQITDNLLIISGAKYAAFNVYDEDGSNFTTVALSGGNMSEITKACSMLGFDIEGKTWPHDPVRASKIEGSTVNRFCSLKDLAEGALSAEICGLLHRLFALGDVFVLKIAMEGTMIGDFTVFMDKGKELTHRALIEVYLRQLGMLITRARAEEKLRQSRRALREAERIARFGNWEQACATNAIAWSETVYDIFEIEDNASLDLYQVYLERIHPEDRAEVARTCHDALRSRRPYEVTHRLLMPGGRIKWVHEAGATTTDITGKPIKTIGVVQDITEQKMATELLKQNEEKYRRIIDNISDVVWTTDPDRRPTYVTPSIERMTGYSVEEYMTLTTEDKYTPESAQHIQEVFAAEFAKEQDPKSEKNRTIELAAEHYRKDGSTIWVSMHVSFLRDETGKIAGLQGVSRDVTEQRRHQLRVEYLSYYDQLTGLFNRTRFEMEMQRLQDAQYLPLGLVIVDVNGLKLSNDAFGHMTGDEVLKRVAAVMRRACRHDSVLARIGGDEFVILLPNIREEDALALTKTIVEQVSQEQVGAIKLSVSCGMQVRRDLAESMASVFRLAEDDLYRRKLSESSSMRHTTVSIIMNTLYEKSPREQQHSHRVSQLCVQIGMALGLSTHDVSELHTAGLMHDIGKIAIEDSILNKPGFLTEEEWVIIKRHPEIGYRILSSVNTYAPLADYVLAHQERWDGKGYPKGLSGEEIPYAARIIAVADAYDAMTTDRPYRKAMSQEAAKEELLLNAGVQFDPHITRVFVDKVLKGVNSQNVT